MVVRMFISHTFHHPVELVAYTHLTKYPTDKEKNVIRVDTLEKKIEPGGILYMRRIAVCLNVIPTLLRKLKGMDLPAIEIEEECWMDRTERTLRLKSRILTWSKYARLRESSLFRPVAENPHWTQLEQTGLIEFCGLGPFGRVLEMFAHCFLKTGVQKSFQIMEELLKERAQAKIMMGYI